MFRVDNYPLTVERNVQVNGIEWLWKIPGTLHPWLCRIEADSDQIRKTVTWPLSLSCFELLKRLKRLFVRTSSKQSVNWSVTQLIGKSSEYSSTKKKLFSFKFGLRTLIHFSFILIDCFITKNRSLCTLWYHCNRLLYEILEETYRKLIESYHGLSFFLSSIVFFNSYKMDLKHLSYPSEKFQEL